jgi:hypothetical protein
LFLVRASDQYLGIASTIFLIKLSHHQYGFEERINGSHDG